jgi:excisionase family DNA binding protein
MSELNQSVSHWKRLLAADSKCATVSVETAGEMLGLSRASAYSLAKTGALPTIRLGRRVLVPKTALEKLLQSA